MISSRARGCLWLAAACLTFVLVACSDAPAATDETDERIARVEAGLCQPLILEGEPEERHGIAERMEQFAVPAVSVAVIDHWELAWARAWGVIQAGGEEPVTTETMFQAGSVSKPVTAVLALALVSDGKLELDAPVNQVLRAWKVPDNEYTRATPVTLRHLLSHQGGFTRFGWVIPRDGTPLPGMADLLRGGVHEWPAVTVESEPGSRHSYSNAGYCVLQLLLEDATGSSLHELASRWMFSPLGMSHSRFDDPLPAEVMATVASGHIPSAPSADGRRQAVPVDGKAKIAPAATGGMWSTASDLARLVVEVMGAWRGDGDQLIAPRLARAMMTPQAANAGLGVFVDGQGPTLKARHGGQMAGFITHMVFYPNLGKGAVVMASSEGGRWLNQELLAAIAREHQWPDLPVRRRVGTVTREQMENLVGAYSLDAAPGDFTFFVSVVDGALTGQINQYPPFELTPTTEADLFVLARESMQIQFQRDEDRAVSGVTLGRAGDSGNRYSRRLQQ